ncbi:MAG: MFS transporter [Rhizobiales bacterium]|nr:MFS transporter [Hyphomicrobiales bacterium]
MPWKTVTALAFSQLVAWGILYYAFAVIQAPMGRENGWSLPQMNGAFSLALCISGLSAYHVGRHIDRQGGRRVMFVGALVAAFALYGWSQVTMLWQFYLVMAVAGIAASMTLYEAAFAVVARLAPQDYRRGITTITILGGLASTCFIPLTHYLVEQFGWRATLLILAGIMLLVCAAIPLLALSPAVRDAAVQTLKPDNARVFDAVKRMPAFWLLIIAYVAHAFFYTALLFNLLPYLAERGFSSAAAVGVYALIGPSQVAGRAALLTIDRHMRTAHAGLIATAVPVIAVFMLGFMAPGSVAAYLFPVLFGFSMGVKTVVQATAAPEFLRQASYGALQGLIALPVALAMASAPFVSALLWTQGGSQLLVGALAVLAVVSFASFALAARQSSTRRDAAAA